MTADHGEGMVFSGYSTPLGSDIFGMDRQASDVDLKQYPVLTYAAGPGQYSYLRHQHPKETIQPSTVPKSWGNHGGEDVALYAVGPLSTLLFAGTVDQTYIPQAIAYVLCISIHADRCSKTPMTVNNRTDFEQFDKLSLTEPLANSTTLSDNTDEISSSISKLTDTDSINNFLEESILNQSTNAQPLSGNCCNSFSHAIGLSIVLVMQILLFSPLL